jgi:hypothetical protein
MLEAIRWSVGKWLRTASQKWRDRPEVGDRWSKANVIPSIMKTVGQAGKGRRMKEELRVKKPHAPRRRSGYAEILKS